jgi:hypothetical protein
MVPTSSLGPAGTKSEWKRIDEVYDAEAGRWIFRDSAPFSGTEVSNDHLYDHPLFSGWSASNGHSLFRLRMHIEISASS